MRNFKDVSMLLSLFISAFVASSCNPPSKDCDGENNNFDVSFAHLGDPDVDLLFNNLITEDASPISLNENFSSYYFYNLNSNFGNNVYGTCSYVSISMLLSFYDTYWSDLFIAESYDSVANFQSDRQYLADFDLIPSNVNSPGISFEPSSIVGNLTIDEYYEIVENYSNTYFQLKLINIAKSIFGNAKFDGSDSSLGLNQNEIVLLLSNYLSNYTTLTSDKVSVQTYSNESDTLIEEKIIEKVKIGIPVLLRAKESNSTVGHSMIAYDYDEVNDEIYVHTGWRDEIQDIALTHTSLSELPFDDLLDLTFLDIKSSFVHSHSYNYHSSEGENICACSFIHPREIKLNTSNLAEKLPTYEWMALNKERWYPNKNIAFEFSILDSNRISKLSKARVQKTSFALSQEEWDIARFNTHGTTFYICVNVDEQSGIFGSDEYWCRKLFTKPLEYENTPFVNPDEYGFADAYPSDETTSTTFINHNAHNNGTFQTRRYRTGFIHNEYIVMSPIRAGFNSAYIEYKFATLVNRIDVQLCHWREYAKEKLDKSNGRAEVQAYINGNWVCQLDMLADSTNLPRNRNNPNTYKIVMDEPTDKIRFYSETYTVPTNNSNLGRICIGNLAYYKYGILPLSGYELDYDTSIWHGETMNNNCYAYALNNQVWPGTNDVWFMQQPGEYSDTVGQPFTKEILKNAVSCDFAKYNADFNTCLIFKEVGKYSIVPNGTYKVALVSYENDYHWYRQDSDGYWSHKPGLTSVKRTDNSGDLIFDPEICDRGNYINFLGFYAVTPWNNLYE